MSDNPMLWISIGGAAVGAALIIALTNYLSNKSNQRRASRMQKDINEGKYDKAKKYFGDQGKWQTDEYSDSTNAPPK
jgi:hypothetical protein